MGPFCSVSWKWCFFTRRTKRKMEKCGRGSFLACANVSWYCHAKENKATLVKTDQRAGIYRYTTKWLSDANHSIIRNLMLTSIYSIKMITFTRCQAFLPSRNPLVLKGKSEETELFHESGKREFPRRRWRGRLLSVWVSGEGEQACHCLGGKLL